MKSFFFFLIFTAFLAASAFSQKVAKKAVFSYNLAVRHFILPEYPNILINQKVRTTTRPNRTI